MTADSMDLDPTQVKEMLGPPDALAEDVRRILDNDVERHVAAKILPVLAGAANAQAEANMAKKMVVWQQQFQEASEKAISAELEKIREANKPPDPAELSKLLNQEYVEFTLKVRGRGPSPVDKDFVIRELVQATEIRLVKLIQTALLPRIKELSSLDWQTGTTADKLQQFLNALPDSLELLHSVCKIILDPYEEDVVITEEWVSRNLSFTRIVFILDAQILANRYRDFLSLASRLLPSGMIG